MDKEIIVISKNNDDYIEYKVKNCKQLLNNFNSNDYNKALIKRTLTYINNSWFDTYHFLCGNIKIFNFYMNIHDGFTCINSNKYSFKF